MSQISPEPLILSALNRLLRTVARSIAIYLDEARPAAGADRALPAELDRLIADQRLFARRITDAILRRGGQPEPGPFPIEMARLNDLDIAYIAQQLVDHLHADAGAIEQCAVDLASDPQVRCLAEEVLGNIQGHLEILGEMMRERPQ
jgi:hypothetical protein